MAQANDVFSMSMKGTIVISGVTLVDKPFTSSANTPSDLLNKIMLHTGQVPISVSPVTARPATAADILRYGPDVAIGDLIAPIEFNFSSLNSAFHKVVGMVGYQVTQRFQDNKVAPPYTLKVRNVASYGPGVVIYDQLNRDIVVTPLDGGNSVADFMVVNMTPSQLIEFDTISGSYSDPQRQTSGFLDVHEFGVQDTPINQELGLIVSCVLIFTGQVSVSQTLTVLPYLADENTVDVVSNLIMINVPKQ